MDKKHLKKIGLSFLAGFLLLTLVGSVFAQDRATVVDWFVIASGGGQTANGTVNLNGTLGQAVAGPVSADNVLVESGYWHSTASADLSLTKTDSPDPVYVGGTLTYTLSVSNAGPSQAINLTVTDTLPGSVTFQTAAGTGWTCNEASGVVTCTRASLAVGAAPDIVITVMAPDAAGQITNSATVTTDTHDPVSTNDTDMSTTVVTYQRIYLPLILR